MTNLLRKLFIKNYQNVSDKKVREKHGLLASLVGINTNLLLFVFKIVIGSITKSISIISDAINNLSDISSGVINLVGFKIANKPADKDHPYGHQRIEYIAGLIVSFIIIALAAVLGYTSIMKIVNKTNDTTYSFVTFIILGVAILIKLWQGLFYRKMSKLINSVSLKAASQDSFNDVLSTAVVLCGALLQFLLYTYVPDTRNNLYLIDGIMGIAVALAIIVMGIKLVFETANPLIGSTPDPEFVNKIIDDILKYEGAMGVHDLSVHSYGPTTYFMTIHVEVDAKVNVMDSHDLIDNIEHEISNKYGINLTIHMDPILLDSPEINGLREEIEKDIKEFTDSNISFHDLRIVKGPTHTNVLFDIVIPFDVKVEAKDLIPFLQKKISKYNKKYFCVINVDRSF